MVFSETFYALTVPAVTFVYLNSRKPAISEGEGEKASASAEKPEAAATREYANFRNKYLLVYCTVMAGDWLQGPYFYSLYRSHGLEMSAISVLLVTGYLSSAVFGALVGSIADQYGRKRSCLWFTVLYSMASILATIPSFPLLMIGKIFGGISTSLLYSVFESWMVSQHVKEGFSTTMLSQTFSWGTFLNGFMAILCGLFADSLVKRAGNPAPFYAAIGVFSVGAILIYSLWTENYGSKNVVIQRSTFCSPSRTPDRKIAMVGLLQVLFEGAMFSVISLWGPILEAVIGQELPYGIIFSSFMMSMMIGSLSFQYLCDRQWSTVNIGKVCFLVSSLSLIGTKLLQTQNWIFWCFNAFEFACGMYFPMMGTLRSTYVPEKSRSTIMNLFGIPLNIFVASILLMSASTSATSLLTLCSLNLLLACGLLFGI
ncbi:DUF791-domain-containing protein [Basidiobolus meristosporus CBS 931.73]|uniref:Molybdate-anion transporter n=1 Tax=Basidiobolus meristosporus CBS 931.73 TaxID=1314790 RepID=A0A1Y1YDR1_9FUNG|nr:DUF791-domain-containing protein [Basidiobolus meristosporus CBS 931.73]|eukprot:ORX96132.1 DUF791-domain-containing protein [Basidiobolus meristosporus CBS 931.73]